MSARHHSRGTQTAKSGRNRLATRLLRRYSIQLPYRPPLDWDALVSFLGPRAIPGVEIVESGVYRRTIEMGALAGWFEVHPTGSNALHLSIRFPESVPIRDIAARVRWMFGLDVDPQIINAHLARDSLLEPLVARRPGLRVPRSWDGFELGVRAILGQQVSIAAATTLAGRLAAVLGRRVPEGGGGLTHIFPSPKETARWKGAGIGMPRSRAEAIRLFASAVESGNISLVAGTDPDIFRQGMRAIPGIGDWTAEYVALRGLGDPDAFPASDLGLIRAASVKTPRELAGRAAQWRPWRAYAALHLWLSLIRW